MKFLDVIDRIIGLINEFIASFGIAAGVLLAFINVVARFAFHEGIDWAFELTNYLFIWSAFFGASYCFRKECHIRVTILLDILPPKLAKLSSLLAHLITLGYLLAVAYYGYLFIFDPDFGLKASGEISVDLNIPMWIPYLVIPIAFLTAAYRVFDKTIELIKTPADQVVTKTEHEMIIEEMELQMKEVKK
ncbi:TRAP transporter small permease [Nautilia sp. PV-1]|jgi:C4-dicarboxylate transporter DctQ subunit|uniref:TRAP transporter small permease n=1 Tax=Nautilia sp. PV-1 TaxID=2579250 RepID=UPI000FD812F8|nr:TRAP transporter small permease [Nautilia sp. PV-1]AZV47181.1 TRAP transporter small permease [Nautilia sp. PV-1]